MPLLLTLKDRFVQMKQEQFARKAWHVRHVLGMEVTRLLSNTTLIAPYTPDLLTNDTEHISYTTIELPACHTGTLS